MSTNKTAHDSSHVGRARSDVCLLLSPKPTVDSGEALHDDGAPPQVSWLQGGMFSAGALSVVLISDHHPVHAFGLDYTDNKDQGKNVNCRQEWTEQTNKGGEGMFMNIEEIRPLFTLTL